jgi:hypothetical protein
MSQLSVDKFMNLLSDLSTSVYESPARLNEDPQAFSRDPFIG